MSLRTKFFAGIIAISAFAVASYAQDAKPEVKADGAKVERKHGGIAGIQNFKLVDSYLDRFAIDIDTFSSAFIQLFSFDFFG